MNSEVKREIVRLGEDDVDTALQMALSSSELTPWSDGRLWDPELVAREICHYTEMGILSSYEIGRRLIWAKAELKPGAWTAWRQEYVPFISESTAQRHMRLAAWFSQYPSLLKPMAGLGLKKALLLTTLPQQDIQDLMETGEIAGAPIEDLEAMPYAELRRELEKAQKSVEELSAQVHELEGDLATKVDDMKSLREEIGLAHSAQDREALKVLEKWRARFDELMAEVGFGMDGFAEKIDSYPRSVQLQIRGLMAYFADYTRLEDCRLRTLGGECVMGSEWPPEDGEDRPASNIYELPKTRRIPFADEG